MEKLFTGFAEHARSYFGGYRRQEAWVPRDPDMGGGKRGKVDWYNRVEKVPGVEDSQQVAGNKAAH